MNTVESPRQGAKKTRAASRCGRRACRWRMAPQAGDCAALSVADPVVYATVPDRVQDKSCRDGAGDPSYTELMEWADGQLTLTLNFANFLQLTDDPLYFEAYLQSLQVAGISTICCLLLGYPLAPGGGAQQAVDA